MPGRFSKSGSNHSLGGTTHVNKCCLLGEWQLFSIFHKACDSRMGDRVGGQAEGVRGLDTHQELHTWGSRKNCRRDKKIQTAGWRTSSDMHFLCAHAPARNPLCASPSVSRGFSNSVSLHLPVLVQAGPLFSSMAPWDVPTYLSSMKTICKLCSVGARVSTNFKELLEWNVLSK